MKKVVRYENYPAWVVAVSNFVTLGIYGLGLFIMIKAGAFFAVVYGIFIFFMEFRILRFHCTNCYYWGKTCGFGRGRISRLFFKKGDPKKFCAKKMTWADMIPDLIIVLAPFITGLVLLFIAFNWYLIFALLLIMLFTTMGNGYVRGKLTCCHCKQAEIGCPALDLFNKGK
jgi:hypothetical protein